MIAKLKSLKNHQGFMKYFKNTSWLFIDKIIKIVVLLFVNIFLARYLGPEDFGFLSYSVALIAIFSMATHLGLGGLVVKELVSKQNEIEEIIGTVFFMKLFGAFLGFSLLFLINIFTEKFLSLHFYVLLIISFSIFFKPCEVFDLWFSATVRAKYTALSSIISLIIISSIKIIFIFMSLSLVWFALSELLQSILIASLFLFYFYKLSKLSIFSFRFSFTRMKYLFSKSWMIMLGSLFAIIYLKIDQIMIKWIIGEEYVGIYSVASSLSEVWYFLPAILMTSIFPKLIQIKENTPELYKKRFQQLYDFLFMIAFSLAVIVSFFATDIIVLLYGDTYKLAGVVLGIHVWAGVFIFMRALFSKWIIMEDVLIFSLITQGFGAASNIILNLILIPIYGVVGAAVATILSYAIASYFALLFYDKTREIFFMMTMAMIAPFRYSIKFLTRKLHG